MSIRKPPIPGALGIDTSRAQPKLDHLIPALMEEGVEFAIFKASDGRHDGDPTYLPNMQAAVDAGMLAGAYLVLEPYGEAGVAAQVTNAVRHVQGSGAAFWAVDFELAKGESAAVALNTCAEMAEGVRAGLGPSYGPGMLYFGEYFIEGLRRMASVLAAPLIERLAQWPIWCPDYRRSTFAQGGPTMLPPFDWSIWQYGPEGSTLPGTNVAVDANVFRGTLDEFRLAVCGAEDVAIAES